MVTKVQKWGNSQGLRIAKSLLEEVGIHCGRSGSHLDPATGASSSNRRPPCADDMICSALVSDMPDDYRVAEEDWGPPVGREAW